MRDQEEHQQITQASVLDRLIDEEPQNSYEPVQYRLASIRQVRASVVRDLENLLNTRRHIVDIEPEYKELGKSLFVYGVKDFTSKNPRSPATQKQLKADIMKTIELFEPRLHSVTVQIELDEDRGGNVHFRINGLLVLESDTEPVTFDTYFDVNRGEYVISK